MSLYRLLSGGTVFFLYLCTAVITKEENPRELFIVNCLFSPCSSVTTYDTVRKYSHSISMRGKVVQPK